MTTGLRRTTNHDDDRITQMHEAYVGKVNALVAAGREGLARELAEAYREESAAADPSRTPDAPAGSGRRTRLTRDSLRRLDRYTLEVFNPGAPYRPRTDRSA